MKPAQCVSASCWLSHRAEEQWGDKKKRWRHMTVKLCKQDPTKTRTHARTPTYQGLFPPVSAFCSDTLRCGALCQTSCPMPCMRLSPVPCLALPRLLVVSLLWSREDWVKGWLGLFVGGSGSCLKMLLNLSDLRCFMLHPWLKKAAYRSAHKFLVVHGY